MPACKKRNVQYFNLSVLLNCSYCYIKAATNYIALHNSPKGLAKKLENKLVLVSTTRNNIFE